MDPGSETMTINQDYSGSDPEKCKTDADCPGVYNICLDDGKCQSIIDPDHGFVPKMGQDYSGPKTDECKTDVECPGEFNQCIAGECVPPKPIPDDSRQLSRECGDSTDCIFNSLDHKYVCIDGSCMEAVLMENVS